MATNIAINPKVKTTCKVYSKKNPVFIRGLNKGEIFSLKVVLMDLRTRINEL